MDQFFDNQHQKDIDAISLKLLQAVMSKSALEELAQHGFHFQKEVPERITDAAFTWLDDAVFGPNRIHFYSKNIQVVYEDFVKLAETFSSEKSLNYSSGKVNAYNLSSEQKRDLQEKLSTLAKKTFATLENLFTVAEKELTKN